MFHKQVRPYLEIVEERVGFKSKRIEIPLIGAKEPAKLSEAGRVDIAALRARDGVAKH